MSLRLSTHWIWDSWSVDDDDGTHHLFFLKAPRSLGRPDLRHPAATVGHAVSTDWVNWRTVADALTPAPSPAWDDLAIWTGSIVRGPTGRWHLFYTGPRRSENGLVQRIGRADSDDLYTWQRLGDKPLVEADPRWYEKLDLDTWPDEAWRDPWVFRDPDGDGWHMLITARAADGDPRSRGVIGHARSADLADWEVLPPLTAPGGFGHLEVPQVAVVAGRPLLVFCCRPDEYAAERRAATPEPGVWTVPGAGLLGPFDVAHDARRYPDPSVYAARLIQREGGNWALLGFRYEVDGEFVGDIISPVDVTLDADGTLRPVA
jgi:beta-fructofuranosidase